MLIIFDVDGTLLDGELHDWAAFDQALFAVLGFAPTVAFVQALPDVTARTMVEAALRAVTREPGMGLEEQIEKERLDRLRQAFAANPLAFAPRPGAAALLAHLNAIPGFRVAIATGDWYSSISFKLAAAGLDLSPYPMATATDASRRSEIIQVSARKAGGSIAEAIYVGDGPWDLRACLELGIPFIGTGSRPGCLREAGAAYIAETLAIESFMTALRAATQLESSLASSGAADRLSPRGLAGFGRAEQEVAFPPPSSAAKSAQADGDLRA
jgi:phosphoglycolate phosphatase-like HAD superfamily hydrolase